MTEKTVANSAARRSGGIFRKSMIMPAEHGSWSWLLVPFGVGAIVAGVWTAATWLTLIGGLALFLMRRPATQWVRIRSGRGRQSDESLAAGWTAAFAVVALLCLVGLFLVGTPALLWLIPPAALLLIVYLSLSFSKPSSVRNLWLELAGAAGLALMAPAAYIAGTGRVELVTILLWLLLSAQNVLGVLYVRVRIADTHQRPAPRVASFLAHLASLASLAALAFAALLPWLTLIPFVGLLARAAWTVQRPRPIANIKAFGFSEIGVEIVGGVFFALAL